MIIKKYSYIVVLVALSIGMTIDQYLMNSKGYSVSALTDTLWMFVFMVLTVLWAVNDSKLNKFDAPFDFDFLMYILWPVAFPYYLVKTRRIMGIVIFIGFVALYLVPEIVGVFTYMTVYSR